MLIVTYKIYIFTFCVLAINILKENAKDTADFCLLFDRIFDSVNGNFDKVVDGKIYRTGVKKHSIHHDLWNKSVPILSSMYFVNPKTKKRTSPQPPSLKNWAKTIRGNQHL